MKRNKIYKDLNDPSKGLYDALAEIVSKVKPQEILEVGTGWGVSAVALLHGNDADLASIDKIKNLPEFEARTSLAGVKNRIIRYIGDSKEILKTPEFFERFDLVFIDGSHHYEDVFSDIVLSVPLVKKGGLIVFDDFLHPHNWDHNYGIYRAVAEYTLKYRKKLTVIGKAYGVAYFKV